jgi:SOS-response transcriptional repressor LexA
MKVSHGQILKKLLRLSDMTGDEFAERMGYKSRSSVYNLLKEIEFTPSLIDQVCKILGVDKGSFNPDTPVQALPLKKGVPVYNVDFTAGDVTQFDDERETVIGYVDLEGFRKCKWIIRVKGQSMQPDFMSGDFVGLETMDKDDDIIYGNPYAITTITNQKLIKIIKPGKDDNHIVLKSSNKEFDDVPLKRDRIDKIYKVHGPIRDQWQ